LGPVQCARRHKDEFRIPSVLQPARRRCRIVSLCGRYRIIKIKIFENIIAMIPDWHSFPWSERPSVGLHIGYVARRCVVIGYGHLSRTVSRDTFSHPLLAGKGYGYNINIWSMFLPPHIV